MLKNKPSASLSLFLALTPYSVFTQLCSLFHNTLTRSWRTISCDRLLSISVSRVGCMFVVFSLASSERRDLHLLFQYSGCCLQRCLWQQISWLCEWPTLSFILTSLTVTAPARSQQYRRADEILRMTPVVQLARVSWWMVEKGPLFVIKLLLTL